MESNKVDMSDLAMRMLEWERQQKRADALRATIETAVMQIGRTQTVGNVRATYSKGRKSYDYSFAAGSHPEIDKDILQSFTFTPSPRTDWRGVCGYLKIEKADIPFTQSEPTVKVKLLPE